MQCREELRKIGRPYPKSSCAICGSIIRPNWSCPKAEYADLEARDDIAPEYTLKVLKELRRNKQEESDKLLDQEVSLRGEIKELNMEINKYKRVVNENKL